MYVCAPFLTYWSLSHGLPSVVCSYGILSASAMNMAIVPTFLIPTAWFPEHRGKIIGFVQAGFGLSSTVFTPIQTFLINPNDVSPTSNRVNKDVVNIVNANNTETIKYFTDEDLLERVPSACLYISAMYGCILLLGLVLVVGPPKDNLNLSEPVQRSSRVRKAVIYLIRKTFTRLDFYLLFLTRLLILVVVGGILGHWKTLSLTVTEDDQLISMIGSFNGILNCLSRFIFGLLIDHFTFRQLMPTSCLLLAGVLSVLVIMSRINLVGFVICLWATYALAFAFNTTVPIQVMKLFGNDNSNVVLGAIGLSDTFSFFILGVLNQTFFTSSANDNSFLWFFLCLGGFAGASVLVSALVSVHPRMKSPEEESLLRSSSN